jgi:hypothetical protein
MKIYQAICDIMSEVGAIGKDKKNVQQNFMYRGIDDVMNALQPLLVKHRVFAVPEILSQQREERQTKTGGNLIYSICNIKYTFYADDGSSISATVIGEGMDSGDKATNKAMAIAMKYACFQVFCIPTEEMQDPDKESHEVKPKQQPQQQQPQPQQQYKQQRPQQQPQQQPQPQQQQGNTISEGQAKRLFAISKGNANLVKEIILNYGFTAPKDVTKDVYNNISNDIELSVNNPFAGEVITEKTPF